MNNTGYIYGARDDAGSARREARPENEFTAPPPLLQPAVVKEVQASGVYKVATLGDDGEETAEIEGVRCFPVAELQVDQSVWLVNWPGSPLPIILVAGGGGTTCAISIDYFGVHLG